MPAPRKRAKRRTARAAQGARKPRQPARDRLADGTLRFRDFPDFRPNLTPAEIFRAGAFGGTYWRPIRSAVARRRFSRQHLEFPASWWRGVPDHALASPDCQPDVNKYGVTAGSSLREWETKGWIDAQDPYGWVQWYCRFYRGRRTPDDARQVARWAGIAGPTGRFRRMLAGLLRRRRRPASDFSVSPKIRQTLLHWAYEFRAADLR